MWISLLLVILLFGIFNPDLYTAENFQLLFSKYSTWALLIYFLLGVIRSITLLPFTPLLLAGIVVFDPALLFLTTMVGVAVSSTLVYFWSEYLGFDQYFHQKFPNQLEKTQNLLKKNELGFIFILALFPFAPTEILCYVCEIMKINYWKCLSGVLIGTGLIYSLYIFGSSDLIRIIK